MRLKKFSSLVLFIVLLLISGYEFFTKLPLGNSSETSEIRFVADLEQTTSPLPAQEPSREDYQDILNTGDGRH